MNSDTVIVRIENGHFAGLECVIPTLRRVAVVTDGFEERVALAHQLVSEHEIAEAVRVIASCRRTGAWHLLDAARDVVAEAEDAASEVSAELAARLHVPIADRIPDLDALLGDLDQLRPLIDEARRRHAAALAAWQEFECAYQEAASVAGAAHDGRHHQPLVHNEEGNDHVRH